VARVAAGAHLVFIAGQGGETETGELVPDFRLQVRQALRNLQTALAAAEAHVSDLVKLTVLIVDHSEEQLRIFGKELSAALGDGPKPACTLIRVWCSMACCSRSRRRPFCQRDGPEDDERRRCLQHHGCGIRPQRLDASARPRASCAFVALPAAAVY
jgi:enamine deaminase RidA (YjgF/YER057c/UK114 family)